MGLRFKEKGQYLRSFVADESLFIDIMMNVGIIFYAAQQSGDADLLRKAHAHCLHDPPHLVRGDGSTSHEGHLRSGDRRVPAPDHPPGLAWRLGLGAGPGLGAVRLRHGLCPERRAPLSCRPREMCADYLHRKHLFRRRRSLRPRCAAQRLGRSRAARPKARQRPSRPAACSTWPSIVQDPVHAARYRQAALHHPGHPDRPRVPG